MYVAVIPDDDSAHAFVAACHATSKMLYLLKKRETPGIDLDGMDTQAERLGPLLSDAQKALPADKRININIPKVHALVHFRLQMKILFFLILC